MITLPEASKKYAIDFKILVDGLKSGRLVPTKIDPVTGAVEFLVSDVAALAPTLKE